MSIYLFWLIFIVHKKRLLGFLMHWWDVCISTNIDYDHTKQSLRALVVSPFTHLLVLWKFWEFEEISSFNLTRYRRYIVLDIQLKKKYLNGSKLVSIVSKNRLNLTILGLERNRMIKIYYVSTANSLKGITESFAHYE